MIVSVQGNVDDDARDIRDLMRVLKPIHEEREPRTWRLDCRGCRYLGPWAAAVLLAAHLKGVELGQTGKIRLPADPAALVSFCRFSGLDLRFGSGQSPSPDHPQCETLPLDVFQATSDAANWDRPRRIIRLLKRHTAVDPEREDQILTCVHEVIQNVVDHSRSTIGGVLCARYISSKQEVRVAIVDRGLGIAGTLIGRRPDITDAQTALRKVIEGGVSSRSRPNNMGLGISNLFLLVSSSGGRMLVCTGNAWAEVRPGTSPMVGALQGCIPGTGVFFTLPVHPPPS